MNPNYLRTGKHYTVRTRRIYIDLPTYRGYVYENNSQYDKKLLIWELTVLYKESYLNNYASCSIRVGTFVCLGRIKVLPAYVYVAVAARNGFSVTSNRDKSRTNVRM